MSTTYNVIAGDTFESVSRKVYGSEIWATRIQRANPGARLPLPPGATLVIPAAIEAPSFVPSLGDAASVDEVSLKIGQTRFRFWTNAVIRRSLDTPDSIELEAPFDPDASDQRRLFRPFSYQDCQLEVGGERLFTGTLVGVRPTLSANDSLVSLSGYSKPGVLADCTPPVGAQLEFNGLRLGEIASALLEPFGIKAVFETDDGPAFDKVACGTTQKIWDFLVPLAAQRNFILGSTQVGELVFRRPRTSKTPVARLSQGQPPTTAVKPFFDPREYYSHITGREPVVVLGSNGSQFTVKNARLTGVLRPVTFKPADVQGGDVKTAVEAKAARMFGGAANYEVEVAAWRDTAGRLWQPGELVTLQAPGAMVYNDYIFMIRNVFFNVTPSSRTALLVLVVPEAFTGALPENLPWD